MSTRNVELAAKTISPITSPQSIAERVRAIDWEQVSLDLDAQGISPFATDKQEAWEPNEAP
jgi:hypothetical protein